MRACSGQKQPGRNRQCEIPGKDDRQQDTNGQRIEPEQRIHPSHLGARVKMDRDSTCDCGGGEHQQRDPSDPCDAGQDNDQRPDHVVLFFERDGPEMGRIARVIAEGDEPVHGEAHIGEQLKPGDLAFSQQRQRHLVEQNGENVQRPDSQAPPYIERPDVDGPVRGLLTDQQPRDQEGRQAEEQIHAEGPCLHNRTGEAGNAGGQSEVREVGRVVGYGVKHKHGQKSCEPEGVQLRPIERSGTGNVCRPDRQRCCLRQPPSPSWSTGQTPVSTGRRA